MNICCFTGHRKIPENELSNLQKRLRKAVKGLLKQGVTTFYTGGALGFDTLAAQAVLNARRFHPQVKLILALPCHNQAARWKEGDRFSMNRSSVGRMKWYTYPSTIRGAVCSSGTATWPIIVISAFVIARAGREGRRIR